MNLAEGWPRLRFSAFEGRQRRKRRVEKAQTIANEQHIGLQKPRNPWFAICVFVCN